MTTKAQYRAVTERRTIDAVGLTAVAGVASTGVMLFVAATINSGLGGWPIAAWGTVLNDANLATVVTLTRRGVYHIALGGTVEASGTVALGISLNSALLTSASNPVNGTAGILMGQHVITPAATQTGINLAVTVPVSDTQAGVGAVFRFHGNDGAAGALAAADIIEATTRYTVTYLGDHMGV